MPTSIPHHATQPRGHQTILFIRRLLPIHDGRFLADIAAIDGAAGRLLFLVDDISDNVMRAILTYLRQCNESFLFFMPCYTLLLDTIIFAIFRVLCLLFRSHYYEGAGLISQPFSASPHQNGSSSAALPPCHARQPSRRRLRATMLFAERHFAALNSALLTRFSTTDA